MSDDARINKIIDLLTQDGGDLIAGRTFYHAEEEVPSPEMVKNGWNVEGVTVYRHRLEWVTHVPTPTAAAAGEQPR